MRILSVDYDYFLDTDVETRNWKFPDGSDQRAKPLNDFVWARRYDFYPELRDIDVTLEERVCYTTLSRLKTGQVLIADSHREIGKLFKYIKPEEPLEVINIDFHHDNYVSSGNTLDCGNWVMHLMNLKPDTKFLWVKREDSETESLAGVFPYPSTTNLFEVTGEFDYVFICFSPEWTPPHLRERYEQFLTSVSHLDKL